MHQMWPDWHKDASCRYEDYDLFFGADSDARPALTVRQIREVRDMCEACPVFTTCLNEALSNVEEYGIWAGTTGRARRKIQRFIQLGAPLLGVVEDFELGYRDVYERARMVDYPLPEPEPILDEPVMLEAL